MAYPSVSFVTAVIKVARPIHWVKNLALFAPIFLTGLLFEKSYFITVLMGFFAFNFVSSAAYIINDIVDAKNDRLHPIKKYRPIAAGKISPIVALMEAIVLAAASFFISSSINYLFFSTTILYFVIQIFYSLVLKDVPIIDIIIIAAGFVIRVFAGAFAINAHLSVWFLLCVVSTALFLASGKRRSELNLISDSPGPTRKSLSKYSRELLNSYVTMFASASWMSWSLYTFFESPRADLNLWIVLAEISKTTTISKLLMTTIPVVIFGIMRYQSLIFEDRSEAPEKLLLTDSALLSAVFIWAALVYWIIYSGVAVAGI